MPLSEKSWYAFLDKVSIQGPKDALTLAGELKLAVSKRNPPRPPTSKSSSVEGMVWLLYSAVQGAL